MGGKARVPRALRDRVAQTAGHRCGYCRTPESITGVRLSIEHIIPETRGGLTVEENLWLACRECNEFKGNRTHGRDPATGRTVRLWNPRRRRWSDDFAWSEKGTVNRGMTPSGRATVIALRLNRPHLVAARSVWSNSACGRQGENQAPKRPGTGV